MIAFDEALRETPAIEVVTAEAQTTQLTSGPKATKFPAWSPDGQWIAFEERRALQEGRHLCDLQAGDNAHRRRSLRSREPYAAGSATKDDNAALTHRFCNLSKGAKTGTASKVL